MHGLFMEAMGWDDDSMTLVDSRPGEMNPVSDPEVTTTLYALCKCPIDLRHIDLSHH